MHKLLLLYLKKTGAGTPVPSVFLRFSGHLAALRQDPPVCLAPMRPDSGFADDLELSRTLVFDYLSAVVACAQGLYFHATRGGGAYADDVAGRTVDSDIRQANVFRNFRSMHRNGVGAGLLDGQPVDHQRNFDVGMMGVDPERADVLPDVTLAAGVFEGILLRANSSAEGDGVESRTQQQAAAGKDTAFDLIVDDAMVFAAVNGQAIGQPGELDAVSDEGVAGARLTGGIRGGGGPRGQRVIARIAQVAALDGRVACAIAKVDPVGHEVAQAAFGQQQVFCPVGRPESAFVVLEPDAVEGRTVTKVSVEGVFGNIVHPAIHRSEDGEIGNMQGLTGAVEHGTGAFQLRAPHPGALETHAAEFHARAVQTKDSFRNPDGRTALFGRLNASHEGR